jgi:phosphatidylinositol kinase/protein kinase (PI-3  family)
MEWDKMEYLIVILLIILIFKEQIIELFKELLSLRDNKPNEDEVEVQKQKEFRKEFDKMMEYSVEDAIRSKRSGING